MLPALGERAGPPNHWLGVGRPLIARGRDCGVTHYRVDGVVIGQRAIDRDAGAERLHGLVADMGEDGRRRKTDSGSAIAEGKVGGVGEPERGGQVEASAWSYYRIAGGMRLGKGRREVHDQRRWGRRPMEVMVTVSWFAGVPRIILSPTAKPVGLRTLMLVAPARAFARAPCGWSACRPGDGDGLDAMANAVDVQADLVTGRDVGGGRDLDVGRAGGRVRTPGRPGCPACRLR